MSCESAKQRFKKGAKSADRSLPPLPGLFFQSAHVLLGASCVSASPNSLKVDEVVDIPLLVEKSTAKSKVTSLISKLCT